jgi:pimeloyl-ACP methyl ester carboxylesterase
MLIDDQSYADLQKLIGSNSTYRNEIAARSILTFDDYNPANSSRDIQVPTLIVATKEDRLAPYEAVEALARTNGNVTVETFEGGTSTSMCRPSPIRLRISKLDFS